MTTIPQLSQRGTAAIAQTFATAKAEKRAMFMPYWMIGYPDLPTSVQIIQMLINAGADAIELGVPFSDPVADGVVVQMAGQVSLGNGTTLADCLGVVKQLRDAGATIPLLLMSYTNPPIAYGLESFVADAATAGADGFIIPDLPPEEAGAFRAIAQGHHLALIAFLAPTSNPERIKLVADTAEGFIYLVSVTGVTGARDQLSSELPAFIGRVRQMTDLPLIVGFGISQPDHIQQIKQMADGVILASALLRTFAQQGSPAVEALTKRLRSAC